MSQAQNQLQTAPPLPGGTLVFTLNAALLALLTQYKGHPAPSYTGIPTAGMIWIDDTNDPVSWTYKVYDGAQWLIEGYIDPTNHQFYAPIGGEIATLTSASTVDLGAAGKSQINITGGTTITSFGSTALTGQVFFVKFSGSLTLTNSGSLVLPGSQNIVTAAGDTLVAICQGSGNWIIWSYTIAAQAPTPASPGQGFVNKFRNPGMEVAQRGPGSFTVTTAGAYTLDGWIVVPTGASCAAQQGGVGNSGPGTTNLALLLTGATSVTDILVKQRIESSDAAPLSGQQVTASIWVFNSTGSTITPTLTVKRPTGGNDNWGGSITTDVNAVSFASVLASAWTHIAYTFAASTSSGAGLEITFDFGNNFSTNGKQVYLTCPDIRLTPGVATGISNPPTPEVRPYAIELLWCQRYLPAYQNLAPSTLPGLVGMGLWKTSTSGTTDFIFPTPARAQVTGAVISSTSHFEAALPGVAFYAWTGGAMNVASTIMGRIDWTVASSAASSFQMAETYCTNSAASIIFTGAEL